RFPAEPGGTATEHLRPRLQLDVDLEAHDRLPLGHDPLRRRPSRHLRSLMSSVEPTLIAAAPGRSRTPAPARARGRPETGCSPRAAARSAAARPGAPPRGR